MQPVSLKRIVQSWQRSKKPSELKTNLKEIKMNTITSKIEFFSIALIAVAFAAAQVTAMVSVVMA
jgi:hypothetical protein